MARIILVFSFSSLAFSVYKAAGLKVCSFINTVIDKTDIVGQIRWDRKWFNMLSAFIPGSISSLALTTAVFVVQTNTGEEKIAIGTYFLITVLGYQIGEITWNYILVSVEAFRISRMKHKLYPLRPADTVSLNRTLLGYNQIAALNSVLETTFISGLALLLPEHHYLRYPILIMVLVFSYLVIGLSIFVPRLCVQHVVQDSKIKEMNSIQGLLIPLYNRIDNLSNLEFEKLKRLDEIHEIVQGSCENFLPLSTLGRVLGTFFLPTITFILAVASETYLQMLLEKFIW